MLQKTLFRKTQENNSQQNDWGISRKRKSTEAYVQPVSDKTMWADQKKIQSFDLSVYFAKILSKARR